MPTEPRAHGLNRAERTSRPTTGNLIHPGQVPTGINGSAERAVQAPTREPKYEEAARMANTSTLTVRTRVDVEPSERLTATDSGYSSRGRKANWRDYQGR